MPKSSGIAASKITIGTMRLHERNRNVREWVWFFEAAYEMGVRKMHSSSEYESYPILVEILKTLKQTKPAIQFRHIVKLANPSFDELGFSSARLTQLISQYQHSLKSDCVSDIQWMWRQDLANEKSRLNSFQSSFSVIEDTVVKAKEQFLIERFLCFPYSTDFAALALNCNSIDGLVVYRNHQETEYDAFIDESQTLGKPVIVIRPFNGGRVLDDSQFSPKECLAFALDKPAIESAIISSGNIDHVRQLIEA
jgi:hypothetical protein